VNFRELIPHLAKALEGDLTFFSKVEAARRRLPLPDLMQCVGDGHYVSGRLGQSPFHPEGVTFSIRNKGRKWSFTCIDCGKVGNELDYLRLRFGLTEEQAAVVFCALSKLV
jgi:hypothetical protein